MVINGKTQLLYIDGQGSVKTTRVLGYDYNRLVRKNAFHSFQDASGTTLVPSKGASWADVGLLVRSGKSAQASKSTKGKSRQPSRKEADPVEGEAL
jgi:hypothetical protein